MPADQIWSCHVSQEANFEKFLFVPILHLILGKVTKFLVKKLSTSVVSAKNLTGGGGGGAWKTPPSAFRVNVVSFEKKVKPLYSGHLFTADTLSGSRWCPL